MVKKKSNRGQGGRVPLKQTYNRPIVNPKAGIETSSIFKEDHKEVIGNANPFSPEARGCKQPDDDSSLSVPFSYNYTYDMDSSATGQLGISFDSGIVSSITPAATYNANGIATWAAGGSPPDASAIQSAFSSWRVVSWGVRCVATAAPTNQSGYVKCFTVSEDPTGAAFDASSSLKENISVYPTHDADVHWIGKPVGVQHKEYVTSWQGHGGEEQVVFYAAGLPASTPCFQFHVFVNLEMQIEVGSITASLATPAAEDKPHVRSAVAKVHNTRAHTHNGSTGGFWSKLAGLAKNALADVASAAVPYIGNVVGGLIRGSGQRRGQLMLGNGNIREVD